MNDRDPKRLLDELDGGDLRKLLEAGKSETPGDRQMLLLAAKIGIAGGLGGAGAAGAGGLSGGAGAGSAGGTAAGAGAKVAVASAVKVTLTMKIVGAVAVAGAVGASAVVVSHRAPEAPHTPVGLVATPSVTAGTISSDTPKTASNNVLPAITDDSAPAPSASVHVAKASPSASAQPESAEAEVKLLEQAQDALRTSPANALALCSDHARRFPKGMLVQEREVIAIEALMKSGRTADAQARADRFKQRFPGSSHTRRIDAIVGAGATPPP